MLRIRSASLKKFNWIFQTGEFEKLIADRQGAWFAIYKDLEKTRFHLIKMYHKLFLKVVSFLAYIDMFQNSTSTFIIDLKFFIYLKQALIL